MTDYSVKRSYRGEILVAPPGADPVEGEWITSKDQKRYFRVDPRRKDIEKYGRTSSAGKHLSGSGDGLAMHRASMAAIGVLMSPEASSEITTLINEYDGDPYYAGRDGGTQSGKSRLLAAVNKAADVAGASSKSALGTEMHKLGELVNKGKKPTLVREVLKLHLENYQQRVAPITFLAQEILIINDELKKAGSTDYLMELPAGLTTPDGVTHCEPLVVVGDLKTGQWAARYPAGVYAQLAGYGTGLRYDQETNTRSPLHERINNKWAVLVHYPLADSNPQVNFYWVDLEVGLKAAQLNNQLDRMIAYFGSEAGRPVQFEME